MFSKESIVSLGLLVAPLLYAEEPTIIADHVNDPIQIVEKSYEKGLQDIRNISKTNLLEDVFAFYDGKWEDVGYEPKIELNKTLDEKIETFRSHTQINVPRLSGNCKTT